MEIVKVFHLNIVEDPELSKYIEKINPKELIFMHTSFIYIMLGMADKM